jgi:pyruvate carboxylase subunit B
MILGKMGTLPSALDPEIIKLAKENNLEFFTGDPQSLYPDALDNYRKEMKENKWDLGKNDEELFELAMHDVQYRDYKSGIAKERFNKELEDARAKANAPIFVERQVVEVPKFDVEKVKELYPTSQPIQTHVKGKLLWQYDLTDVSTAPIVGTEIKKGQTVCFIETVYNIEPVIALADGKIVQIEAKQGQFVEKNQVLAFIN